MFEGRESRFYGFPSLFPTDDRIHQDNERPGMIHLLFMTGRFSQALLENFRGNIKASVWRQTAGSGHEFLYLLKISSVMKQTSVAIFYCNMLLRSYVFQASIVIHISR